MRDIVLTMLLGAVSAIACLAAIKAMTPPAVMLPLEQWTCTRVERVHSIQIDLVKHVAVKHPHASTRSEDRCVVYERKGWR
jgi:hypothetical protein